MEKRKSLGKICRDICYPFTSPEDWERAAAAVEREVLKRLTISDCENLYDAKRDERDNKQKEVKADGKA